MIIDHLEEHFGKMTVTRGKEHMFLGMKIHYTKSQTAVLSMKSYLEEAIKECFMNFMQKVATPVKQMLFEVDPKNGGPEQGGRQTFPQNSGQAAQCLYMGKSRHSFAGQIPMYQGIKSTEQDQARLKWVLEYVSGTINLEYILGSNSLNKLWTWVDA